MYLGSNSFFNNLLNKRQVCYSFSMFQNPDLVFLIKGEIIANLQGASNPNTKSYQGYLNVFSYEIY